MNKELEDNSIMEKDRNVQIRHGRYRSVLSAFANPRHGGTYLFIGVAAVVVVLTAISYGVYYFNQDRLENRASLLEVSSGDETRQLNFSDGSEVWLEPSSTVNYPEEFPTSGDRIVDFRGEALFEIVEDPERPFVIHTGSVTATVLGTSVSIKTTAVEKEVYVFDGNVLLTTQTQKLELGAEEKVVYVEATHEFRDVDVEE